MSSRFSARALGALLLLATGAALTAPADAIVYESEATGPLIPLPLYDLGAGETSVGEPADQWRLEELPDEPHLLFAVAGFLDQPADTELAVTTSGSVIASDSEDGHVDNAVIAGVPVGGGHHTYEVSHGGLGADPLNYVLAHIAVPTSAVVTETEGNDTIATAEPYTALAMQGSAAGSDEDYFEFDAPDRSLITVIVDENPAGNADLGDTFNSAILLINPDGKKVAANDNNSASDANAINHLADGGGSYVALISGGGTTSDYRFVVLIDGVPVNQIFPDPVTVTTTDDVVDPLDGEISLREAVTSASLDGVDSTVRLAPDALYELSTCGPDGRRWGALWPQAAEESLTIDGRGATISQQCDARVILAPSGVPTLTLANLTLDGGEGVATWRDLVLIDTTITNMQRSGAGAAAFVVGNADIVRSTITNNRAYLDKAQGGAVAVSGHLHSEQSSFTGNSANGEETIGGAISAISATLINTTVADNDAALIGGVFARDLELILSTVVGDAFGALGSSLSLSATASVISSCINIATVTSGGHNHDIGGNCELGASSDSSDGPAGLNQLDDGAPSPALVPIPGSILLDRIPASECAALSTVDQRGAERPEGDKCDIGAIEGSALPASGGYVPLTPERLLDTRSGVGVRAGSLGAKTTIDLPVLGRGGVPASGVDAVVLNVTSTESTTPSFITVWPTGQPQPLASSLNTEPGQDTPNLVIAKVGAGGQVSLYNNAGTGHLVADVAGYVPTGGAIVGIQPGRVLDTRSSGIVGPGFTIVGRVTDHPDVPADARAVVLNLTSTQASTPSFITVWPTGQPRPLASSLNTEPGQDTPNLVIAPIGEDGQISIYNNSGSGHLVADVLGYVPATSSLYSLASTRAADTRTGPTGPLGPRHSMTVRVAGTGGVPVNATAVILNMTSTGSTAPSFLTLWPTGEARPNASNLNTDPGQDTPNLVIAKVGAGGQVSVYNNAGVGDVVVDIVGYVI